jgi:hypothetical protein
MISLSNNDSNEKNYLKNSLRNETYLNGNCIAWINSSKLLFTSSFVSEWLK